MKIKIKLSFIVVLAFIISCKSEEEYIAKEPIESLKESPYRFGAAIKAQLLRNNPDYQNLVVGELTSITAENDMKMNMINTGGRGDYYWDDADFVVRFGQENNIRVHGHTLVRYTPLTGTGLPQWIKEFSGTKQEWKEIMKEYITEVVTRYKGKISSWDVVNEAIKDDGTFRPVEECIWTKNIGVPEYIDWAFQCAHEADPNCLLFYNDYGHEYSAAKRTAVNNLIKGMQERGVPIHGIGMQMHTNINRPIADLRLALESAVATGLLVHVSELDVAVNTSSDPQAVFSEELAGKQRDIYRVMAYFVKNIVPENQRYGITTWGLSDQYSFQVSKPDWPLLFDKNYQKKAAYEGVLSGLNKE